MIDKKLLHAADEAAERTNRSRSALVSDGLREHLCRLDLRAWEERDRQCYLRRPQADGEARGWEAEALWLGVGGSRPSLLFSRIDAVPQIFISTQSISRVAVHKMF
jgi:hypothetical protein